MAIDTPVRKPERSWLERGLAGYLSTVDSIDAARSRTAPVTAARRQPAGNRPSGAVFVLLSAGLVATLALAPALGPAAPVTALALFAALVAMACAAALSRP